MKGTKGKGAAVTSWVVLFPLLLLLGGAASFLFLWEGI